MFHPHSRNPDDDNHDTPYQEQVYRSRCVMSNRWLTLAGTHTERVYRAERDRHVLLHVCIH